jgi:TPR repeat protein
MVYASACAGPGDEAGPEAKVQANNECICWYRMAASQGQVSACALLGHHYTSGKLGTRGAEAVEFLRQAADAGHTEAAVELAGRFRAGRGVARDHAEAFRLFKVGP